MYLGQLLSILTFDCSLTVVLNEISLVTYNHYCCSVICSFLKITTEMSEMTVEIVF